MSLKTTNTLRNNTESERDIVSPAISLRSGGSEMQNVMIRTSKLQQNPKFDIGIYVKSVKNKTNIYF